MLMLCLRMACIRILSVKAFQSRRLKVVRLHASFLDGFRSKDKDRYMAKVQILTFQSIDGYMVEGCKEQYPSLYDERAVLYQGATFILNADSPLSMLMEDLENECNDAVYLIEALPRNESIINTMLQMRLVDEIVICTVPVLQGNGTRLFRTCIPPATCWESESTSISKNGTVRTVFRKIGPFDKNRV